MKVIALCYGRSVTYGLYPTATIALLYLNSPFRTSYRSTEGEFGIFLVTNGSNSPYHHKIRAPGPAPSQGLDSMSKHHMPADLVTIIGT
ncbi:hypothetical protein L1049_012430 [Liquidambar formosana]|uniref:NADH-quinone oxidoreductase subunit D domain-containing protein n=1 Tax=Liquidambar formosana TaxID=63359 RepID=A0AAP0N6K2_LIQFO